VRSGLVTANARVVKAGRTIGLVECDLLDAGGSLVARAGATQMTLRGEAATGR
jgi:acyl-coenzyme A thioesterase PaaI-like protein